MAITRNRGELEAEIMGYLWAAPEPLTAKELQQLFDSNVPAITTLITVLDRMCNKGQVTKCSSGGRSQVYAATHSQVDHVTTTMTSALHSTKDRTAALLHFAGSLTDDDRAFLRHALDNS